eukprot:UN24082
MESERIERLRKKHLLPAYSTSYRKHLNITRGVNQYLISASGKKYLDCVNNVCHVGHCHKDVVKACTEQIKTLNTNTRYLHGNIVKYAEKLSGKFPSKLTTCVFTCSGSEANEVALRMARYFAKSDHVVVFDHAYHGNTTALIGISPYKFSDQGKNKVVPKPKTTHVLPVPDMFRGKYRRSQGYTENQLGKLYAKDAEIFFRKVKGEIGNKSFVFMHESILGCAGQVLLPKIIYHWC